MNTKGDRIRWARKTAGLSQAELASLVGVTKGAVSLWETNQTKNLKNDYLFLVAEKTKVNPKWLVSGEGDAKINMEDEGSAEAQRLAASIMRLAPHQRAAIQSLVDSFSGFKIDEMK